MAFNEEVGVDNLILLEEISPKAIVNNLRLRFEKDIIYTYIGAVLVSMNPYKNIGVYSEKIVDNYRTMNLAELPPHIFALSDNAYKALISNNVNQSVLISGESGAGKTEALKRIILYISKASHQSTEVERVCYQLKESVPFLEAFGNAKTIRNDNSSRFGKYMDIEINFRGAIVGAKVINYLLEKARVIKQTKGERNFHIFYQLLAGDAELLQKLFLTKPGDQYRLINQGGCMTIEKINDKEDFDQNVRAMEVCAFVTKETYDVYALVACCLHLYEISYEGEGEVCKIAPNKELDYIIQLLNGDQKLLEAALTGRTITVAGEKVKKLYNKSQAQNSRDSLIKAMYERCFNWLVIRINQTLSGIEAKGPTKIGLLDIYGFEIFEKNGFEQFCINFCNEHLHQLFVQRTLKMEQEEYMREGIKWESVDFFDNRPILDLIEENKKGIIYVLDEECVMPGERSDITFLQSMEQRQKANPFFASYNVASDPAVKKMLNKDVFLINHYAGKVRYCVEGFLEKNRDAIVKDLKIFMNNTDCLIIKNFYKQEEIEEAKRPPSAGMQFKNSLSSLVSILMKEELYYIRCLKPNEEKKAGYFNDINVEHQVLYLGLIENIRVCRSGYAYRKPYDLFLKRYYPICDTTWPKYSGDPKANVLDIIRSMGNYEETKHYGIGKTKIFIRSAKDVMVIEQKFQKKRSLLAADIQAVFKADRQKKIYHKIRGAIIVVQKNIRRYLARKKRKRLKWANLVIKGFVLGYRHYKKNISSPESCKFFKFQRYAFLMKIAKGCPLNVMHKKWPTVPPIFLKPLAILKHACYRNLVKIYMNGIKPGDPKDLYLQKITAEKLARERERLEKEEAERVRREQLGLPQIRKSERKSRGLFSDVESMEGDSEEDLEDEYEECEEWEEGEEYYVDEYGEPVIPGLPVLPGPGKLDEKGILIPPGQPGAQVTTGKLIKKKRRKKMKGLEKVPGKLAWQYICQAFVSTYEGSEFDEGKLHIQDEELLAWVQKRCREIKAEGSRYINRIKDLLDQATLTEQERNPPIIQRTFKHIFTLEYGKGTYTAPETEPSFPITKARKSIYGQVPTGGGPRIHNTGAGEYRTERTQRNATATAPSYVVVQAYPVILSDFSFDKVAPDHSTGDSKNSQKINPEWFHFSSLKPLESYDPGELEVIARAFILLLTQFPYSLEKYEAWRQSKTEQVPIRSHEPMADDIDLSGGIVEEVRQRPTPEVESGDGCVGSSSLYYLKKVDVSDSNDNILSSRYGTDPRLSPFTLSSAIKSSPTTPKSLSQTSHQYDTAGDSGKQNTTINIIAEKGSSKGRVSDTKLYLKFGDAGPVVPLKSVKESDSGFLIAIDKDSSKLDLRDGERDNGCEATSSKSSTYSYKSSAFGENTFKGYDYLNTNLNQYAKDTRSHSTFSSNPSIPDPNLERLSSSESTQASKQGIRSSSPNPDSTEYESNDDYTPNSSRTFIIQSPRFTNGGNTLQPPVISPPLVATKPIDINMMRNNSRHPILDSVNSSTNFHTNNVHSENQTLIDLDENFDYQSSKTSRDGMDTKHTSIKQEWVQMVDNIKSRRKYIKNSTSETTD